MIITFECLNATDKIVFHTSEETNIDEVELKLSGGDGATLNILDTDFDDVTEFYTISLDGECVVSDKLYSLEIHFDAPIRRDLEGFYVSSYFNTQTDQIS